MYFVFLSVYLYKETVIGQKGTWLYYDLLAEQLGNLQNRRAAPVVAWGAPRG
jgi:hypothetical protein